MTGREKMLLDAIEGMEDQYSSYQDEVVRHLTSDESTSGREDRLLKALVIMVDRLLQRNGGQVDTLAESAGEDAVEALVDFGLMEFVYKPRFARWTEAGTAFLAETLRHRPAMVARAVRRQHRQISWTKMAAVASSIVMVGIFIGWLLIFSLKSN